MMKNLKPTIFSVGILKSKFELETFQLTNEWCFNSQSTYMLIQKLSTLIVFPLFSQKHTHTHSLQSLERKCDHIIFYLIFIFFSL